MISASRLREPLERAVSSIDVGENRTNKTQCEKIPKSACNTVFIVVPLMTRRNLSPARQLNVTNHTVLPSALRCVYRKPH